MQGYALCADCRVFEGLIGPSVHVRMTGEASKCHRDRRETGMERERGERQVERERENRKGERKAGLSLTSLMVVLNEVTLLDRHTSVLTSQPGLCE